MYRYFCVTTLERHFESFPRQKDFGVGGLRRDALQHLGKCAFQFAVAASRLVMRAREALGTGRTRECDTRIERTVPPANARRIGNGRRARCLANVAVATECTRYSCTEKPAALRCDNVPMRAKACARFLTVLMPMNNTA